MLRQAAAIQLRAEQLQSQIIAGDDVSADEVIRLSSECRRILTGLKARSEKDKPAGPTLQEYLASKYGDEDDAS